MVRMKGLEPSRRKAPDPKSGVYTNFTTSAYECSYLIVINGTPYTIRTCDLRLRRALLYPAELRKHFNKFTIISNGVSNRDRTGDLLNHNQTL